jgi:hypothetical protein
VALLPEPVPGLVIRYSYLWYSEHRAGREEGQKDRPCAIVAAIRSDAEGAQRVLVLPVTHSPPDDPELAVEIPARVKERLGLDSARSWVVLSEWNEFGWPGPDLRIAPGASESSVAYGMLPPGLFHGIRDRFLALAGRGGARRVRRTE